MSAIGSESTLNLPACPEIGNRAVTAIHAAYDRYHGGFEEITRRARERFERRDWRGAQADATERLALYRTHVDGAVADVRDILQDAVMERTLWAAMRARHALGARGRPDAELAQTFFNSVTRRVFSTVGVDAAIEYLAPSAGPAGARRAAALRPRAGGDGRRRGGPPHPRALPVVGAVRRARPRRGASWRGSSPRRWTACRRRGPVEIDMVRSVFYRNKGAYVVGRVRRGGRGPPAGDAAAPRRARHRGGRGAA